MKIIEENGQQVIYLQEGDNIFVKTMFKNPYTMNIKCLNHSLFINDIIDKRLKEIQIEQEELKKMREQNKK